MKPIIKKVLTVVLSVIMLMSLTVSVYAAEGRDYNWYCVHRKDHKQPIADSMISFIEQYNGYYIDKRHNDDCTDKVIYLTFDAGYENGNVEKILDVMKEEQVTGAFFILGNLITSNTELVGRMFDEGHLVCNHTYSHKPITSKSKDELENELGRLETVCYEKTGKKMSKYFRPPEGKFDEASMKHLCELGYKTVFWSFAYADWDNQKQMSSAAAKQKILENVHNGEVMLLHPTSATNAAVLGDVIRELKSQGYRFGTLDELCCEVR